MQYSKLIRWCGLAWVALLLAAAPPSAADDVSLKMMTIPGLYGDRLTTYGYLMRPNQQDQPLPAVILLHGGFNVDASEWLAPKGGLALKLLQAGYVVLALEPRGSLGHGAEYAQKDDLGTRRVDDLLSALSFLQSRPQVDPKRIALMGTSRGATLALRAAEMSQAFKLVVGYSTVTDYRLLYCHKGCGKRVEEKAGCSQLFAQEGIPPKYLTETSLYCTKFQMLAGCQPWEPGCTVFAEGSPLLHLEQLHTPVLLHHGEKDKAVPYQDVLALDRRLKQLKIPHQLFIYESKDYGPVGHGFLYPADPDYRPAAADRAWQRTIQALDYYLKGKGDRPW